MNVYSLWWMRYLERRWMCQSAITEYVKAQSMNVFSPKWIRVGKNSLNAFLNTRWIYQSTLDLDERFFLNNESVLVKLDECAPCKGLNVHVYCSDTMITILPHIASREMTRNTSCTLRAAFPFFFMGSATWINSRFRCWWRQHAVQGTKIC